MKSEGLQRYQPACISTFSLAMKQNEGSLSTPSRTFSLAMKQNEGSLSTPSQT
jgi:hypothetical protein